MIEARQPPEPPPQSRPRGPLGPHEQPLSHRHGFSVSYASPVLWKFPFRPPFPVLPFQFIRIHLPNHLAFSYPKVAYLEHRLFFICWYSFSSSFDSLALFQSQPLASPSEPPVSLAPFPTFPFQKLPPFGHLRQKWLKKRRRDSSKAARWNSARSREDTSTLLRSLQPRDSHHLQIGKTTPFSPSSAIAPPPF